MHNSRLSQLIVALVVLAAGLMAYAASIYWEDGDGNSAVISNAGWNDIQTAIGLAANNPTTPGTVKLEGDFIRALGDATVGDLEITQPNITLSGGWNGSFTAQSGRSVLNVRGSNSANNQFRVLTITGTNVTVQSCVISNGWLTGGGGGISVTGNDVKLQDLVVGGNYANGSYDVGTGGGIYIKDIVGGRVSGCIVRGNVGQSSGGGMRLDQCGSATYPLVVENCTIIGNRTVSRDWTGGSVAGGIYFTRGGGDGTGRGFVVIANSLIQNNRAGTGSGIYASSYQANARLTIFGSLITGNYSLLNNGNANGIFAGTDFITIVANSTIADNTHPSQPGQYGIYAQYGGWGLYGRIVFINSIMASNNKGMYDFRQSRSYGAAGAHIDLLRSTTYETEYLQRDEGPYGGPYPNVTNQTASTWSGALAFTNPGYHSRNDSGTVTQNMEQNLNESPGFSGKSPAPYSLVPSSNSRNSGLTLTGAGFTYVDVNYNGAYNAMVDIIVAGTPPAGRHLVYTTDLLGMPRVSDNVIDRGAYEYRPPRGTVVVVR